MKFLTDIDKFLTFALTLFTPDELAQLTAEGNLDAMRVHISYGGRIRQMLTEQSESLLMFGGNTSAMLDDLASWLLMFLYLYQKSRIKKPVNNTPSEVPRGCYIFCR